MLKRTCPVWLGMAALLASTSYAQNQNQQPMGPRTIARNLENPSGVAVHPETGDIFVAERRGVVRFFRQEGQNRLQRKMELSGFPTDVYGKGPMYDIGALGVAFLDNEHLIVGQGCRPDGQELVRVYKVGKTAPDRPAREDTAIYTLGPIKPGDESAMGEGNFYAIAQTAGAIFITSNGDDTKGWILRSEISGGKPGELKTFIATKEALNVDAPCGITVNGSGDLVVGQMGEINLPGDSLLAVFDPKTGKLKAKYETGLNDIVGLAYSPRTGRLYAVDFSWLDTKQGGLFELTISGDQCTARKIFELDKPTSIAFESNGAALITVIGTGEEGATMRPGQLLRVNPRLLQ